MILFSAAINLFGQNFPAYNEIKPSRINFPSAETFTTADELALIYQKIVNSPVNWQTDNVFLKSYQLLPNLPGKEQEQKPKYPPFFKAENSSIQTASTSIYYPPYTQGFFCNFEDHINGNREFRVDFSVK